MSSFPGSVLTRLDERRRTEIMARYSAHARRFDDVARRRGGGWRDAWPVVAVAEPDQRVRLSPRLHEVLTLTADGHTNLEIAERMGISEETVKTHQRNLLRTLAARNRAHAVAIGFRCGLLDVASGPPGAAA